MVGGAANQANYYAGRYAVTQLTGEPGVPEFDQNYLTDAGAFSNSASPYDTFDQGGNVSEWNDAVIGSSRGLRGGSWVNNGMFYDEDVLRSSYRRGAGPTSEKNDVGFRVASVPEPSTYGLILMAGAGCLLWKRGKVTLNSCLIVRASTALARKPQRTPRDS